MRIGVWFSAGALVLAAIAGCYSEATPTSTSSGGDGGTGTQVSTTLGAGLPCEVAEVLTKRCGSCHGPASKKPLGSRADLQQAADPGSTETVADEVTERMRSTTRPMPPTGMLAEAEIAAVESWIKGGMAEGSCSSSDKDAGTDVTPASASVCTSDVKWTKGDRGSFVMHPGKACVTCHKSSGEEEAPIFGVAGTVYPTAHEPDDCNGVNGTTLKATVIVTDADGKEHTAQVNSAGNFGIRDAIKMPYTAKVIVGDKTRAMGGKQSSADCNGCHTEQGAQGAPGRIMAP